MPDDPTAGGQTPPTAPEPVPAGAPTPPAVPPAVPAAAGQTPAPAPASQPAQPATPATPPEDDDPPIKLSEARRMRKEAEDNRKLLAEYAAKIKGFEDEKLTADERLKRDLADYQRQTLEQQRQIQELRVRNAVEVEALRMGFYSPDD